MRQELNTRTDRLQSVCVHGQVVKADCECSLYRSIEVTSWHDTIKYHCDGVVFIWNRIFKEEYNKRN